MRLRSGSRITFQSPSRAGRIWIHCRAQISKPNHIQSSTLDRAEIGIPNRAEIGIPDRAEIKISDQAEIKIPDQAEICMPDRAQ